jgi:hypothetical protein
VTDRYLIALAGVIAGRRMDVLVELAEPMHNSHLLVPEENLRKR